MGAAMFYNDLCPQEIKLKLSEGTKDEREQWSTKSKQDHGHNVLSLVP